MTDHEFLRQLWDRVGIGPFDALAVVVSTIAIYGFFVLLVRLMGQRMLARMSGFDVAAAIALGAITGRVTLGYTPTLLAGALALLTLFLSEAAVGELRRVGFGGRFLSNTAVVLMVDGKPQPDLMRRVQIVDEQLRAALRRAGLRTPREAAIVILERNGEISVLRAGVPIHRGLIVGLRGAERIPPHLLEPRARDR